MKHLVKLYAVCFSIFVSVVAVSAFAQAPAAIITGPIESVTPGDPSLNFIANASAIELRNNGYIEEEYFIEGTANRYTSPELETGEIIDSGHPYKTRFIVRRPLSSNDFNGVVILEWHNVTAGRDLDIDWWQVGDYMVENGYAWIGVSAQRVGVNALKQWSPSRYGSLDVTHNGRVTDDALSYDIFSAIAKSVRKNGEVVSGSGIDILGGLRPDYVLATGHSQSAGRLAAYLNNVHPREPVFDGVMVHGGGGRIRDDEEVKIWKIMAETDMPRRAATRQPDSDTFRQWEVAGSSHVDIYFEQERYKMDALTDGLDPGEFSARQLDCDRPMFSRVPFRYVMHAAFHHLVDWVADGTLPPIAPPLSVSKTGPPSIFARDGYGNVLGGIRLATHAVPTATNTGLNTGASRFCRLYGSHAPFDGETLEELYPHHESYVDAVRRVVTANVAAGYILEQDGEKTVSAARSSGIGR